MSAEDTLRGAEAALTRTWRRNADLKPELVKGGAVGAGLALLLPGVGLLGGALVGAGVAALRARSKR